MHEVPLEASEYLSGMLATDTTISTLLSLDAVSVGLPGGPAERVIERLAGLVSTDDRVRDPERMLRALQDRERLMSTGVGIGLAIPHARTDAVSGTVVAFGVTSGPALFGTPDGVPVRLVFLLVGPRSDMSRHIRILSRVSRLMQLDELRERLLTASEATDVIEAFSDAESALLAS